MKSNRYSWCRTCWIRTRMLLTASEHRVLWILSNQRGHMIHSILVHGICRRFSLLAFIHSHSLSLAHCIYTSKHEYLGIPFLSPFRTQPKQHHFKPVDGRNATCCVSCRCSGGLNPTDPRHILKRVSVVQVLLSAAVGRKFTVMRDCNLPSIAIFCK
jgi:hypothetical protein